MFGPNTLASAIIGPCQSQSNFGLNIYLEAIYQHPRQIWNHCSMLSLVWSSDHIVAKMVYNTLYDTVTLLSAALHTAVHCVAKRNPFKIGFWDRFAIKIIIEPLQFYHSSGVYTEIYQDNLWGMTLWPLTGEMSNTEYLFIMAAVSGCGILGSNGIIVLKMYVLPVTSRT